VTRTIEAIPEHRLAAYHEAGHAWAYERNGLSVEGVSITRVENGGYSGLVTVPLRKLDPWVSAFISLAGPVAEAMVAFDLHDAPDCYECDMGLADECFANHMSGVWLTGGADDLDAIPPMIRNSNYIETTVPVLRQELHGDWGLITDVSEVLMAKGTVTGERARSILKHASVERVVETQLATGSQQ